jgi:hypothetical protein
VRTGRRVGRDGKGGVPAPGRQHSALRKAVLAFDGFFSEGGGVGITRMGRGSLSMVKRRDEVEGKWEERLSVVIVWKVDCERRSKLWIMGL